MSAQQIVRAAAIHPGVADDEAAGAPATALAITDGDIVWVGRYEDADQVRGPHTREIDLGEMVVLPGMSDIHVHHAEAGLDALFRLGLPPEASLAEILAAVAERAAQTRADGWVVGGAWSSALIGALGHCDALARLDAASGGHPVLLVDDTHHNRWANTAAMQLAGIAADTAAPGIVLDDGRPSGLLLEEAGARAARVAQAHSPLEAADYREACRQAIATLASYGITSFQDASSELPVLNALAELDDAGALAAWAVTSMPVNDHIFGYTPVGSELYGPGMRTARRRHRPTFVKVFIDGVPTSRTGAFLEPYLPAAGEEHPTSGEPLFDLTTLSELLGEAVDLGLSVKAHCTGDASVRLFLDAVEALRGRGAQTRFQVAHGQFVHPDDIDRFARLGVIADVSPFLWFPGPIVTALEAVLEPKLVARCQPNRTLSQAGVLLAGGSDWPVSPLPDVWAGIQGLITRRDPAGSPGELAPDEALSTAEAIAVFGRDAARAMGLGERTGTLEVGKSADFIALPADPYLVSSEEVSHLRPHATYVGGQCVFSV